MKLRRPTRRDLLVVIGRLQDLIGQSLANHGKDRNPDGFELGQDALAVAFQLCIESASQDKPIKPSGPWAPPCPSVGLTEEAKKTNQCQVCGSNSQVESVRILRLWPEEKYNLCSRCSGLPEIVISHRYMNIFMKEQHLLHLTRIDVRAATDDQIF